MNIDLLPAGNSAVLLGVEHRFNHHRPVGRDGRVNGPSEFIARIGSERIDPEGPDDSAVVDPRERRAAY
jgi:hypothetical protein